MEKVFYLKGVLKILEIQAVNSNKSSKPGVVGSIILFYQIIFYFCMLRKMTYIVIIRIVRYYSKYFMVLVPLTFVG